MSFRDKHLYKVAASKDQRTWYWILTGKHEDVHDHTAYWCESTESHERNSYWLVGLKNCDDDVPLSPVDELP